MSEPTAAPAKKRAAKPKHAATKYSDDVRAAVKLSKEIRGKSHGEGPAQHVLVRDLVTTLLKDQGEEPTPKTIAKLAGFSSPKALLDVAKGEGGRSAVAPLRPLVSQIPQDTASRAWTQGRFAAAILAAWSLQLAKR
ncbi:hypothetical protein OJ997_01845 [Solirubrobacter phytolaccae]|uniref:Uncharacterized protein n=1 Tax=Solirubrobacter phytolaccae TaxID=1404360 RepID=A0A9X3N784_9ACTN|nr:hypothetical protein [Solirubrobacter phytolaccae]MDA0179021.1 hypothetical protein [Solirubrobacter phytolaccae]